jgi:hypothetical protein
LKEEGSSATDSLSADVTDVRKKEEGRRKKEEGRENFLFEVTNKENS